MRHSAHPVAHIARIAGRVRGLGSEFALACDMRFAARESAVFGQFEAAFGVIPQPVTSPVSLERVQR
jgi:enoyl-CoA hydratase/carnithine racemase